MNKEIKGSYEEAMARLRKISNELYRKDYRENLEFLLEAELSDDQIDRIIGDVYQLAVKVHGFLAENQKEAQQDEESTPDYYWGEEDEWE